MQTRRVRETKLSRMFILSLLALNLALWVPGGEGLLDHTGEWYPGARAHGNPPHQRDGVLSVLRRDRYSDLWGPWRGHWRGRNFMI